MELFRQHLVSKSIDFNGKPLHLQQVVNERWNALLHLHVKSGFLLFRGNLFRCHQTKQLPVNKRINKLTLHGSI